MINTIPGEDSKPTGPKMNEYKQATADAVLKNLVLGKVHFKLKEDPKQGVWYGNDLHTLQTISSILQKGDKEDIIGGIDFYYDLDHNICIRLIWRSDSYEGAGAALDLYKALIDFAKANNVSYILSDDSVIEGAAKCYFRLQQLGYDVQVSDYYIEEDEGEKYYRPNKRNQPVFTIKVI